ncbi:hypothetical protein [Bradyrhizobium oligotrophicum]|uniref:hypothetical protein n=1 Tax=Bradyrhizobium oligotrophicum TaxID=44255 RepID=UPI003EB8766E
MRILSFIAAATITSVSVDNALAASTRCIVDKGQKTARIVAMDDESAKELGWRGPSAVGLRPQIAPAQPDNGNRTPGQYRYAYFYPNHTTAYYTSRVQPQQAGIEYVDEHPVGCGATQ